VLHMSRLLARLGRVRSSCGFTLVELMVAALVLLVGLVGASQFFASQVARVLESDIRSVVEQVATSEMENIRAMPYSDVGTTIGNPHGVLAPMEIREADVTRVMIEREVKYYTDASYGTGGPYPANYRRVTVSVTAVDVNGDPLRGIDKVQLVSNIAGGATGGTILVKVVDSQGAAVQGARFTIVNPVTGVNITSSEYQTDELGSMLVPGLPVDADGNYVVEAWKAGYSRDSKTGLALLEATLQEVVLTIDKVCTMRIQAIDQTTGVPVANVSFSIIGQQGSLGTVSTGDAKVAVLSNLRFSTSSDPYIVTLLSGQGYASEHRTIELLPEIVQDVIFYVTAGSESTTTTSAVSTSTTSPGPTSTLLGSAALKVIVVNSSGRDLGTRADIQLGTVHKNSRNNIVLFEYLNLGTAYELVVTAHDYVTYTGVVTFTGPNAFTIVTSNGSATATGSNEAKVFLADDHH
jgi:prepilin-type N-terminal cleavage/methylation domain-containing protein